VSRLTTFVRAHRVPLALGLFVLVTITPVVAKNTAQPASRLALTAALVEHRTVDVGRYEPSMGVDRATYQGHLRSDKAPGQPLLAAPVYALGRVVGADSPVPLKVDGNLTLWLVTLWSSTLPFAVLVVMLYLLAERFARRSVAVGVALALGFGTLLLPYAANLYGHVLSALLGFAAWFVLQREPLRTSDAALAGLLAGFAVTVEYESAIVVFVLAGYLLARYRHRFLPYVAGGLLPVAVLGWYQWRAFGAPWRTPSEYYSGVLNGTSEGGYTIPSVRDLFDLGFGSRGLWIVAPVVLLAAGCAGWLAFRGAGAVRTHAVVALVVFVPYLVLCAGWSGTPLLEEPGPRYLVPALPFLAVPLAAAWDRVRVAAVFLAVVGALFAFATLWTQILVPQGTSLLTANRARVQNHDFAPTIWSMTLDRFGVLLYAMSVVAGAILLVRSLAPTPTIARQGAAGGASMGRRGRDEQ
jgi:hypothetical protein